MSCGTTPHAARCAAPFGVSSATLRRNESCASTVCSVRNDAGDGSTSTARGARSTMVATAAGSPDCSSHDSKAAPAPSVRLSTACSSASACVRPCSEEPVLSRASSDTSSPPWRRSSTRLPVSSSERAAPLGSTAAAAPENGVTARRTAGDCAHAGGRQRCRYASMAPYRKCRVVSPRSRNSPASKQRSRSWHAEGESVPANPPGANWSASLSAASARSTVRRTWHMRPRTSARLSSASGSRCAAATSRLASRLAAAPGACSTNFRDAMRSTTTSETRFVQASRRCSEALRSARQLFRRSAWRSTAAKNMPSGCGLQMGKRGGSQNARWQKQRGRRNALLLSSALPQQRIERDEVER